MKKRLDNVLTRALREIAGPFLRRPAWLMILAISGSGWDRLASAQPCDPSWLPGDAIPGAGGGSVGASVVWDADGLGPLPPQIVVAGGFDAAGSVAAARIGRWDGQSWHAIGTGMNGSVLALATWDPDGDGPASEALVASGNFIEAGGITVNRIAVWSNGAWHALAGGMDGTVSAVASWDPDGDGPIPARLVAGGSFMNAGAAAASRVAIWDGSTWSAPGTGADGPVFALASWDEDGEGPLPQRLIIAGAFGSPGSNIAAWDGSAWSMLDSGLDGAVNALAVADTDGKGGFPPGLFAGGAFEHAGGLSAPFVARWNGVSWSPLGIGMNDPVFALTPWDSDGDGPQPPSLVAGGLFSVAGTAFANRVARWDGAEWFNLGAGTDGTVQTVAHWDPDGRGPKSPVLIVGGNFAVAGGAAGASARGVAEWNGSAWSPLGAGTDAPVRALTTWDPDSAGPTPTRLFAAGAFSTIGGESVNRIGEWDGGNWTSLAGGTQGSLQALTVWDPDGGGALGPQLIAGGNFTSIGGISANRVARWDGAAWHAMGLGVNDNVVFSLTTWDPDGPGAQPSKLIVGGAFFNAGGMLVNRIAAFDGANWSALGGGVSDSVLALTSWDPDGGGPESPLLIAGGQFLNAGTTMVNRIASWNGVDWSAIGVGPSIGANGFVLALASWDPDGAGMLPPRLVAGGTFTMVDVASASRLASWDGSAWQEIGGGVSAAVRALTNFDPDGPGPLAARLAVAGDFTSVGGSPAVRAALWNGSAWTSFGDGPDLGVLALAGWDPDDAGPTQPWLVAGGSFTRIGGDVSAYLGAHGRSSATWAAAGDGTYSDGSRWLCGEAPTPIDRIFIDRSQAGNAATSFSILLPVGAGGVSAHTWTSRTDQVTLDMRGRNYSLAAPGNSEKPSLVVGDLAGERATLTLRSTTGGPVAFSASGVSIGDTGTTSALTNLLSVFDAAVTLDVPGDLAVGKRGNRGELEIRNGADALVSGAISIGSEPGAVGEVRVINPGSTLMHSDEGRSLAIGHRGTGTLRIGGTTATLRGAAVASLARMDTVALGADPTGVGSALIIGQNSSWTIDAERLHVGLTGVGSIRVEAGALLDTDITEELWIARRAGSAGSVTITGNGSLWRARGQPITIARDGAVTVGANAVLDTPGINLRPGGRLAGNGQIGSFAARGARGERIAAIVTNFGVIDPGPEMGAGVGSMTIIGDYRQAGTPPGGGPNEAGSLAITLAGTAPSPTADMLAVSGQATLGGGLIVTRAPTLAGAIDSPITVLTADSGIQGFFDVAFLPPTGDPAKFFRAETVGSERGPGGFSVVLMPQPLDLLINTTPASQQGFAGVPTAATTGDFNNDGLVDVAIVIPSGTPGGMGDLVILYNLGVSGEDWLGWSVSQFVGVIAGNPSGVAGSDVDNDKWDDIVVPPSGPEGSTVTALRNDQSGGFMPGESFNVGRDPRGLHLADLDGDGFADLAVANAADGTVSLLRNLGGVGPGWQGFGQSLGVDRVDVPVDPSSLTPRPIDVRALRMNAGPRRSIVTANEGSSSVSIISNTDGGPWAERFSLAFNRRTSSPPGAIGGSDVDNDKWDDIVVPNPEGTITLLLNRTDGSSLDLHPGVEVPVGDDPSSIAFADLNLDGSIDIAVAATVNGSRVVQVLRNDEPQPGRVTLSPDQTLGGSSNARIVLAANVNPSVDLRDDLIVLGGSEALRLGASRGEPPTNSIVLLGSAPPPPPCIGDANGDRAVNFADVTAVLTNWSLTGPPHRPGDADGNGVVNFADVTAVLTFFGTPCPT